MSLISCEMLVFSTVHFIRVLVVVKMFSPLGKLEPLDTKYPSATGVHYGTQYSRSHRVDKNKGPDDG